LAGAIDQRQPGAGQSADHRHHRQVIIAKSQPLIDVASCQTSLARHFRPVHHAAARLSNNFNIED